MESIYLYVFHYNPYRKQWACVKRNAYTEYLNGMASYKDVVYADSIDTLLTQFTDGPEKEKNSED